MADELRFTIHLLTIPKAVEYIKVTYGVSRSRQTIYNWIKKGAVDAGGEMVKLESELLANQIHTAQEWLDTFISRIEQR